MSTFWLTARTMQTLSIVALEEASREGRKDADLEHLFLALLLSDQPAGDAIRGLGITLDSARHAIQELRSDQLGSLGIEASVPHEGRILFHEQRGNAWVDRVTQVFQRASGKGRNGGATEVLKALVSEPSGTIADLLARLGTTPTEVRDSADREEKEATPPPPAVDGNATTSRAFVPAPLREVWSFLADPVNLPQWIVTLETVESPGATMRVGDSVEGRTPDDYRTSGGTRVHPLQRRKAIELALHEPPTRIAWRISQPDAPLTNANYVRVTLDPTPGGTRVTVRSTWVGPRTWRKRLAAPLRPLMRAMSWMGTTQYALAISRAFR